MRTAKQILIDLEFTDYSSQQFDRAIKTYNETMEFTAAFKGMKTFELKDQVHQMTTKAAKEFKESLALEILPHLDEREERIFLKAIEREILNATKTIK